MLKTVIGNVEDCHWKYWRLSLEMLKTVIGNI